jgi:hypothetical protein
MMAKDKQKTPEPKVNVKLLRDHEHARVPYKKDAEFEVPLSTAEYMREHGIAELVK